MPRKDDTRLLRAVQRTPGWRVQRTRNNHFQIFKEERLIATGSISGKDRRAATNLRAQLRRAGWTEDR